ncbi:hypothetical protein [Bradyrhizobium sp. USDA 4473]
MPSARAVLNPLAAALVLRAEFPVDKPSHGATEECNLLNMKQHEYFDLLDMVSAPKNWAFVAEAYTRGLPNGIFSREQVGSIKALRSASILDEQHKLDGKWREAIDQVATGSAVYDLTNYQKKRIVDCWFWSVFRT